MTSKQTFKNQELFSWTFMDGEFKNPNQFKIHLNENFREDIAKDIASSVDVRLDPEQYADYELSMHVGKQFFYFAFIHVFPYQKRIDFLNFQIGMCKEKLSFLYRVESLAQVDYWYAFGENSYYKPDNEKIVLDWVMDRYAGKNTVKSPLIVVK